MRYAKDHREKTRRRIVETASRALRRNGIGASGVVGLMSEAGLTQGGFYTHFASKDALVGEAIDHAQKNARRWLAGVAAAAREKQGDPVSAVIDAYLSVAHLDAAGGGCTLAALGSEIGHQSDAIRRSAFSGSRSESVRVPGVTTRTTLRSTGPLESAGSPICSQMAQDSPSLTSLAR